MGFIATPERKSKMDLAYFMWTEPHTMVVPLPGEEPRLFAFIRPFQPQVNYLVDQLLNQACIMTIIFPLKGLALNLDSHDFNDDFDEPILKSLLFI